MKIRKAAIAIIEAMAVWAVLIVCPNVLTKDMGMAPTYAAIVSVLIGALILGVINHFTAPR